MVDFLSDDDYENHLTSGHDSSGENFQWFDDSDVEIESDDEYDDDENTGRRRCRYKQECLFRANCRFYHTEEEEKIFNQFKTYENF